MKKLLIIFFVLFAVWAIQEYQPHFLPKPKTIKLNFQSEIHFLQDPCKILYHVENTNENQLSHFKQVIESQQKKTFNCKIVNLVFGSLKDKYVAGFDYTIHISVDKVQLKSAFTTNQESYRLNITNEKSNLKTGTYVGMVRGLETFLQSFQCPKSKFKNCSQKYLPITIEDQPAFSYRGLMVDTSRHFLPKNLLFETIDAMMYNKLNIFHWHITDEDSFPLILDSHPQIAKHGSFSPEETYTTGFARELVRYAMVRGVRVIPQLDTPGHAASWGRAPENVNISCKLGNGYMGSLDVTLQQTYKLVKQVFAEIMDIFPDPLIHLGGDQVVLACAKNKTKFLQLQKISEAQMEMQYRRKQYKIIKELNGSKIPLYWLNERINSVQSDAIIHWWGQGFPSTKNKVVISNYGPYYLDMGVGNYLGNSYGNYRTWLELYKLGFYQNLQSYNNKNNVLGAEVCLWSQMSNRYTHHMKIWIRSSSFAEKIWNTQYFDAKPGFFGRLTAHERLMNRRGIPTAPATCQQCETHPQFC